MSGETRGAISGWTTDTLKEHHDSAIAAIDAAWKAKCGALEDEIRNAKDTLKAAQLNAKDAVDKAERAQAAHNVAQNEWRATLNDFKASMVSRPEFERLDKEFAAYRLQESKGVYERSREQQKESKEDWKSLAALVISIGVAVLTYFKH